jgi:hypothetical protein
MEHSDSPAIWDHTTHSIRSRDTLPEEPRRTVPGNAWCYECQVPLAAHWDVDQGLNYNAEEREFLLALKSSKEKP